MHFTTIKFYRLLVYQMSSQPKPSILRAASATRSASKHVQGADTPQAAAKSPAKPTVAGSVSPRKQLTRDSTVHDTKQLQKRSAETVATRSAEPTRGVGRRSVTDVSVSKMSRRDSGVQSTGTGPQKRTEKLPSSRGGRQGGRKPLQRTAMKSTEPTAHVDSNQQTDEKGFTSKMLHVSQ